jgi:probable phosphoglycerate mutase
MGVWLALARHGETADNARRVFQGQGGSGLNRLGRAQAARLADRLRRAPPRLIVSSDLARAMETARIVADACGSPVEVDRGLREVDVGTWTGKSYEEVEKLFPEEWAARERGFDVRRGGGETYAELSKRMDDAIARIAARAAAGERVLIVSHGGAIKSWIAKLLGLNEEGMRTLGGVANAGLTVVERLADGRPDERRDGRQHRLHTWNDSAHLEGLVAAEHAD